MELLGWYNELQYTLLLRLHLTVSAAFLVSSFDWVIVYGHGPSSESESCRCGAGRGYGGGEREMVNETAMEVQMSKVNVNLKRLVKRSHMTQCRT